MGGMVITGFLLNSSGMKQLLNEDYVRDHITHDYAEPTLAAAQAGYPGLTYRIEQGTTDRVRVAVGSDDEGALFIESATGNLLRALDAGGG